jgi:hypothetical protein
MGNVSQYVPSIHPTLSFRDCNAVPHTVDFAEAALSPAGDSAVIDGAIALALTATDIATDQELRNKLHNMRIERVPMAPAGIIRECDVPE